MSTSSEETNETMEKAEVQNTIDYTASNPSIIWKIRETLTPGPKAPIVQLGSINQFVKTTRGLMIFCNIFVPGSKPLQRSYHKNVCLQNETVPEKVKK